MTMNKQKSIKFINESNCLVDYNELEKAILWYQERPTASNKKIYLFGNYPAVSIHGEKIHVHRLLMMYWLKSVLPTEYSVHHINNNKLDARQENLSLMLNSMHNSIHMKGTKFSKEHRKKISEANRKRKGTKIKKRHNIPSHELSDLLKYGFSILGISELYKVDWSTIKSRIYENPELMEVVD